MGTGACEDGKVKKLINLGKRAANSDHSLEPKI